MSNTLAPRATAGLGLLPDSVRLGAVHLTVANLGRSVGFYRDALGLAVHHVSADAVALGAGPRTLVVLHEQASATPADGHAGLGHLALRVGSAEELAAALARLDGARVGLRDARDFPTHTSLYVADPDGTGIELAWDKPRAGWAPLGAVAPRPVDLEALRGRAGRVPLLAGPGLSVGHVHLDVGGIVEGLEFYAGGLGFGVRATRADEAYLAAAGYHHHVALGSWREDASAPAPAGGVGLRCWTLVLPGRAATLEVARRLRAAGHRVRERGGVLAVRDPWGLTVALVTAPA